MAHFAKLGTGNIVERVSVVSNDIATTEQAGIDFLKSIHGEDTIWKQTSYNGNMRKNFAGIGYKYNQNLDQFVPPKPFDSWTYNSDSGMWEAPVEVPSDDGTIVDGVLKLYRWDEFNKQWIT
jgi:hypothetical protein|tara:strand:+ start:62 stop:427 length:366 start_codon:yes stop_codon:yes gene_type:complete